MNPNDIIQQQQALINQAMQNQQNWVWGILAFQIASMLLVGWVVYMFYARLSDIAEELMKIRVAYRATIDREEDRRARSEASKPRPSDTPFASGEDKYKPKV